MRLGTSSPVPAVLAVLPTLVRAVSLSDMKPRASDLPTACNKIYTKSIDGCTPDDFITGECSSSCYSALQDLVAPIKSACSGEGIEGQNLIVAFLANVGPEQLCPSGASGSGSRTQETTSSTRTSTTTKATNQRTTRTTSEENTRKSVNPDPSTIVGSRPTTSKSSKTVSRPAATPHSTEATGTALFDTPSTSTAESTNIATSNLENDGDDNGGGGSPFDTDGDTFNSGNRPFPTSVLTSLAIAVVMAAAVFW